MISRLLESVLLKDLGKKMVMLAGPRQCGKTTLSKLVAKKSKWSSTYYNWDIDRDRKLILQGELDARAKLWVLDELHKYRRWRNWLKGKFDQFHPEHAFLVTGSGKLDVYSRGGDSLQGRYFFHRLHPFTLAEVLQLKPQNIAEIFSCERSAPKKAQSILEDLLELGGFPEPFLSGSTKEAARWRLTHNSRIVREEVRSLEQIQDLGKMELLLERLPVTVGSVLSLNSLREDLEVAFETVRNWVDIFERLYAVFRVAPYGSAKVKAVKKEQKLYFWDWAQVESPAARLENLVALHLLRFVHWQEDVEGEKWDLRYFRDVQGHEVDFVLLRKGKPWCCVEVKLQEQSLDSNLKYFLQRVKCVHAFQVSLQGQKDWEPEPINGCHIRVLPAASFLAQLS